MADMVKIVYTTKTTLGEVIAKVLILSQNYDS